jgi:tetraprenyl-beta-curcumene synthase
MPAGSALEWWELAAGGGSSLGVHALIAVAAAAETDRDDVAAVDSAYFPWIGALHSLLDSLVDRCEDERDGQRSFLDYYASPSNAALRMGVLARRARSSAEALSNGATHRVILNAMACRYLSCPECRTPEARMVSRALSRELGVPVRAALPIFRLARRARALTRRLTPMREHPVARTG